MEKHQQTTTILSLPLLYRKMILNIGLQSKLEKLIFFTVEVIQTQLMQDGGNKK